MPTTVPTRHHRHRRPIALAGVSCAVAIAACGSSAGHAPPSRPARGGSNHALKLVVCLRAHGVPNLPDPGSGPPSGGSDNTLGGVVIPSSINPQAPAFRSAERSCANLFTGVARRPALSERQKVAAIANARCMRRHGVPDFPDPRFSSGDIAINLGSLDPHSPAFRTAMKACSVGQ